MAQCPECGNHDAEGLGFCITCGKVLPKSIPGETIGRTTSNLIDKGAPLDLERAKGGVFTSLSLVVMTAAFILLYLLMNETDPLLIIMVEAFPLLWFFLILIQWRSIRGKSGNS